MAVQSGGILLYRRLADAGAETGAHTAHGRAVPELEVMLVHPGGPLYKNKDLGQWSIPKGEYDPESEDPLSAARREFAEETGLELDCERYLDLGWIRQRGGKVVHAFAAEGNMDPASVISNGFWMEWPPRSGRLECFPEVDRAGWFDLAQARERIRSVQAVFLDRLSALLESESSSSR